MGRGRVIGVLVAVCPLAGSAEALASVDTLYVGCISSVPTAACGESVPAGTDALDSPVEVVVSGDGAHAYVLFEQISGSSHQAGVAHLVRDPATGTLRFSDCVGDAGRGCAALPPGVDALWKPVDIEVSHDGDDVYVAAARSGTLIRFRTAGDGRLRFAECFGRPETGCERLWPQDPDGSAEAGALAISSDDRHLYVAGSAVHQLRRGVDGKLEPVHCVGTQPWCDPLPLACDPFRVLVCEPVHATGSVYGMAVSGDGRTLYVVSEAFSEGGLARFTLNADGRPSFDHCVGHNRHGCWSLGSDGLAMTEPRGVAVDGNGRNVYVASEGYDPRTNTDLSAVTHFRLSALGRLELASCYAASISRCRQPPYPRLLHLSRSVSRLPDGSGIFVGAIGTTTVARFDLNPDGTLSFASCRSHQPGCVNPGSTGSRFQRVTVSPDGGHVYAAGAANRVDVYEPLRGEPPPLPQAITGGATEVTSSSVKVHGLVDPGGQPARYHFEMGRTTAYGTIRPIDGDDAGWDRRLRPVEAQFSDVGSGATLHYRVVATNAAGTAYGEDRTVTTLGSPGPEPGPEPDPPTDPKPDPGPDPPADPAPRPPTGSEPPPAAAPPPADPSVPPPWVAPVAPPSAEAVRAEGGGAIVLRLPGSRRLRALLRRGMPIAVECPRNCAIRARLLMPARTARELRTGQRTVAQARAAGAGGVSTRLTLRPPRVMRRKLRGVRALDATLAVAVSMDGRRRVLTRRVRLR